MLGEKDLIYLAAALFLTKETVNENHPDYQKLAVKTAQDLYKRVFGDKEEMVCE